MLLSGNLKHSHSRNIEYIEYHLSKFASMWLSRIIVNLKLFLREIFLGIIEAKNHQSHINFEKNSRTSPLNGLRQLHQQGSRILPFEIQLLQSFLQIVPVEGNGGRSQPSTDKTLDHLSLAHQLLG